MHLYISHNHEILYYDIYRGITTKINIKVCSKIEMAFKAYKMEGSFVSGKNV